jgi:hypothetical protein
VDDEQSDPLRLETTVKLGIDPIEAARTYQVIMQAK